jgi:hypothetical protein
MSRQSHDRDPTPVGVGQASPSSGRRLPRWAVGGAVAGVTAVSGAALLCPTAGACVACGTCAGLIPVGVAVAAVVRAATKGRSEERSAG